MRFATARRVTILRMQQGVHPRAILRPGPAQLRDVLRFWTTGVTIVSAAHGGLQHGMTVNSFTSLSLEPPLVSVSLEKVTRTHSLVMQAGRFGVSILAAEQRELSDRFAGRESESGDRFAGVEVFYLESGSPLLAQALAFFDCAVSARHDAGTHTIFISEVLAAGAATDADGRKPLAYFNRGYREIKDA